ncbi:hypothetical protein JCM5353_003156 [Sporobolomyces roseus]
MSQTLDHPKSGAACVFKDHNAKIDFVKDHPVPQQADLKPGEVLVRVDYSGVCHTDLHAWKGTLSLQLSVFILEILADFLSLLQLGDWPAKPRLPLVGGHEGAG